MSNPFKNQYTADGIGTDFVYSFSLPINRAVLVYETLAANQADEDSDLVSDTLYTIIPDNPSSATSTGIVRFNTAPADQSIITITPDQATLVTYVFSNTAPFNTDNLNGAFNQESQTNGYNLQNYLQNCIRYNLNENDGDINYDNKVAPLDDLGFWRRVGTQIVSQDYNEFLGEVLDDLAPRIENQTNASADNLNLSNDVASSDQGVQYSGNPKRVDAEGNIILDPLIQGFSAKAGALWAQEWAESLAQVNDDYGNSGRSARFYSDQAAIAASSAGGVLDQLRIFDTVSTTTNVDLINYGQNPDVPWFNVLENSLSVYVDGVRLQEPTSYSPPGTPATSELTYTVTIKDPPTLGAPSFITFSAPVPTSTEIFIVRSEPQGSSQLSQTIYATMDDLKAGAVFAGVPNPKNGFEVEVMRYHPVGTGTQQPSTYLRDGTKDDVGKAGTDWIDNGLVGGELIAYGPNGEAHVYRNTDNGAFIDITALGLADGGDLNDYLEWACEYAQNKKIKKVLFWGVSVNLTGGVVIPLDINGVVIGGPDGGISEPVVTHTGDNVGITFQGDMFLFSRAKVESVRLFGNAGLNAIGFEFQDSWNNGVEHVYPSGYTNGSFVQLHNRKGWTEGFYMKDIMSRANKHSVIFKRTAASGGTDSFFGFKTDRLWHQFSVPNSVAIDLPSSASAGDGLNLYGANIDIGGWYDDAGGHRPFVVGDYNKFVESTVITKLDGYGGSVGGDFYTFRTSSLGRIDVETRTLNQQGNSLDVSAISGGTLIAPSLLVSQDNKFDNVDAGPRCRAKGARLKIIASGVSDDRTYVIDNLPSYSTWRVIMTVKGTGVEFSEAYEVDVTSANFRSRVISKAVPATSTTDTVATNFKLQAEGGGTGGNFVVNGGSTFEWVVNAATEGDTYTSTLEIEMM
jgi:hypothetical protein